MDNILKNISCGVYIVTSENSGCVINTFTQVTSLDPLVSISINKENYTNKVISKTKRFAVSFLNVDASMELIGNFGFKSSENYDKFKSVKYEVIDNMKIITENVNGYVICDVKEIIDCGTHNLFIGIVKNQHILNDGVAMTYDYYQKVKKGTTPPKAPSFVTQEKSTSDNGFKQYQCIICGHIYDEEVEGISFSDLPDNWVCPKCRVGKDKFKRI